MSRNHLAAAAAESRPDAPPLRLGDVHDLNREHPAVTVAAARALIQRAEQNGLAKHVYRVGRRVYIDLDGFQQWVRSQQGRAAA